MILLNELTEILTMANKLKIKDKKRKVEKEFGEDYSV